MEVCSSVAAVKYLYKYIYKGHDRVTMKLSEPGEERYEIQINQNEVEKYRNGRWVGSCEAGWRLLKYDLHTSYPPVVPLSVHPENNQTVQFAEANTREEMEEALRLNQNTHLTEWFETNRREKQYSRRHNNKYQYDPPAPQINYHDFPKYYKWEKKRWVRLSKKKARSAVGRMHSVHPTEGLFLSCKKNPFSFFFQSDDLFFFALTRSILFLHSFSFFFSRYALSFFFKHF